MNSPDPWRSMQSGQFTRRMILPEPSYGHPFFSRVPSWLTMHDGRISNGSERELFEGAFVGAEAPQPRGTSMSASPAADHWYLPKRDRGDLTAAVAPALAPATGGFTAKVELDDHQRLHASICVDGKCYEASMDLAPAIAAIMEKFAQYHAGLHAQMPHVAVSGEIVVGAVDAAVAEASDALVEQLVGHHVTVACGNFLDDIGNAIKGIPVVGDVFKTVGETVKTLKGPITAAATALGGPAAGALVGPLVDSVAGGKDTPEKKAVEAKAKEDPQVAQDLAHAKAVTAHTIAAHHIAHRARRAAAGHPGAQRDIDRLARDAEAGDPAAHAATPLVEHGFSTHAEERGRHGAIYQRTASRAVADAQEKYRQRTGHVAPAYGYLRKGEQQRAHAFHSLEEGQRWYSALPSAPGAFNYAALYAAGDLVTPLAESFGGQAVVSGVWQEIIGATPWYTVIGAALDDVRKQAAALAAQKSAHAVGVIHTVDGLWHAYAFASPDDADDWFGHAIADRASFTYAAYYEKDASGTPFLLNEQVGGVHHAPPPGPPIRRAPGVIE
jgi:hypothetical protein